ncbi:MAG: hypothetical protein WAM82_29515 [Thermoanaerobaculia bacterium]
MKRLISGARLRQSAHVRAAALLIAGFALFAAASAGAAPQADWPTFKEQMQRDRVLPGSNLEKLIAENQDFGLLRPEEAKDSLRIPLWLRVLWHKNHPDDQYSPKDPTGGYPLVLNEVHEWMLSHQDLRPGTREPSGLPSKTASETGEERISGAQTSPRSESAIRVNYWNPQKVIGASNNISSSGRQAMFFSSNAGVSWGQTLLPLVTGDSFMSDPTVEWTSDGTAWSTTIGINAAATVLTMRSYKSTDSGATWTFDATFSGGLTNNDKQMMWTDHSATSPFKDNIYVIWHPGLPAVVARRTGPTGSWQTPVQISHGETTGTAIGGDIKTNANGDVFGFYPDTGSRGFYVAKSTNGGVSFATPVKIAQGFGSFEVSIPADASRQALIYTTGGAFSDGTRNNVYAAWNDLSGDSGCTSGGGPGTNAASTCKTRIFFSRSTNGGTTWSAPVKINNQSGLNDQFFPWLVVDPTSARISLVYYDTVGDSTRKSVNLYYQSSTDDGLTWSAPFKVTTASTNETTAGADSGNQYGDYINVDGISGTFYPSWTDRRSGASEEIWTAAILDSSASPDFAISVSPTSSTIQQGGSGSATATTTISGGFNAAVALSASGQPSGVTVGFSPTSIAAPGSGSSTVSITVASTTAVGTYPITITGTSGSTVHSTTYTLTVSSAPVPDFAISVSPTSATIQQGGSGSATATTTISGGFNAAIALTASGQPTGVTVGFSPTSIAAPGSGSSTVSITVASSTAVGTYPITITGTSGSTVHSTTYTLTVSSSAAQQLLGNPGFENGTTATPWVPTAGVINNSSSEPPHSGSWDAWMDGYGTTHTDTLYQQVTIPSTATTATLTFWLHIDTAETTTTTAYDTLQVQIRNSSNTVLATLATYSNLNKNTGYAQKSFNLIAYKGQTIRVYLLASEDVSLQTSFVVDDFALNVQ